MEQFHIGARIGDSNSSCMNYSFPFIRLRFLGKQMAIDSPLPFFHTITFPFDAEMSIKRVFWHGLRLCHKMDNCPSFIVLWCWNSKKILRAMRENLPNATFSE